MRAGIHVLRPCNSKDVDGRDKPGHDESKDTAVRKDGVLSHAYARGHDEAAGQCVRELRNAIDPGILSWIRKSLLSALAPSA
jgi:hypothetical protein